MSSLRFLKLVSSNFRNLNRPLSVVAANSSTKQKVCVIGSGNWGTVAARIVGQNALRFDNISNEVNMWVFEEKMQAEKDQVRRAFESIDIDSSGTIDATEVQLLGSDVGIYLTIDQARKIISEMDSNEDGEIDFREFDNWWHHKGKGHFDSKLTDMINRHNENVKYLPGVKLGSNIQAIPDLLKAVEDATLLIFVTPHQFVNGILKDIKPHVRSDAKAISLIKGMEVTPDGFHLISDLIEKELGIECCVLMGANIAGEIGRERFSEATIGYKNVATAKIFQKLFHTEYFHVNIVKDTEGAEMCGTLKNIVALGAGFCDGLGLGSNSKAAIIRIGLVEMRKLTKEFFPHIRDDIFFESAGVADLITTCYGGRNRKCAEAFVLAKGGKTFEMLEKELLHGQKLQGVLTSHEVQTILRKNKLEHRYPLFTTINKIVSGEIEPEQLVQYARFSRFDNE